ncbi:hypothetical protein [Thermococcus sp. 21S7]|uniref:hypothetical protein n=1 Tax=Thermococcus sp. 21S7 TaxID=1638221 RepID=UPI00143C2392|nr:hypothetical protein [Thermococcus sp. 21S7]NJE61919.1 hypothetical protein [Thermococcus sp. 21S7]
MNTKTGSVIGVKKKEAETATANAVREIIRGLREWDGELFGPIRKEDAVSMLTRELEEALSV